MNGHLSKREKVLVMLAICVGLGFLAIKFVILPAFTAQGVAEELLLTRTSEKQLMEMKLSNESVIRETYNKKKEKYEEVKDIYPAAMTNERLDKLITGICLEYNINPNSLGMSTVQQDAVAAAGPEAADAPEKSIFTTANVNVSANGSYGDLLRLIDYVDKTPYMKINLLSYSEPRGSASAADEPKPPEIALLFEVIMADAELKEEESLPAETTAPN